MAEGIQVKVLYDFQAQPNSGELNIFANEILRVTRQDVGDGWWEGVNCKGEVGLFPASYVEAQVSHSQPPPSVPPPPLPDSYVDPNQFNDDWDDDWDDDDSNFGGQEPQQSAVPPSGGPGMHVLSLNPDNNVTNKYGDTISRGSVRKNLNRFSTFVKSGGESFILGTAKLKVSPESIITILDTGNEIIWEPSSNPFTCTIASPKKESKMKGFKTFIAYQITPSFNNIQIGRRYKHFDWLHERMEAKFTLIPVPPLPDKQISGRYEEEFIERRMVQLRSWVSRICRHPVLSRSDVWMHFLTCTDAKRWKDGKRRAEKDELVGAAFCHSIRSPETPLEMLTIEKQMDDFGKFVAKMDESVKNLHSTAHEQIKKFQGGYKKEFQKVADGFLSIASAFELESQAYSDSLTRAIKNTGETYENIGKLYEDQPKHDFEPVVDMLHEYKGMLASWPDILNVHKGALNKKKEYQKQADDNKFSSETANSVAKRTEVFSYAVLAETSHFQQERVADFKYMMQVFLTGQINFYQKIVENLQDSLAQYDTT